MSSASNCGLCHPGGVSWGLVPLELLTATDIVCRGEGGGQWEEGGEGGGGWVLPGPCR